LSGDENAANWVLRKLLEDQDFKNSENLGSGFLKISRIEQTPFLVAATAVDDIVTQQHVEPVFSTKKRKPEFVINVPSKAIWRGDAIEFVHGSTAAFGTLGDLIRASRDEPISLYRKKDYKFFEGVFEQHNAVSEVIRLYDRKFELHRRQHDNLTVVLIDGYDLSAEDVRNAQKLYGPFDIGLKTSSYGSITSAADDAAESMGAEVMDLKDFMRRLSKK